MHEIAKERIQRKEERKAENELKRTIESMNGVYSSPLSRHHTLNQFGSRSPPNVTLVDSVHSMNSYGRGPDFTGE